MNVTADQRAAVQALYAQRCGYCGVSEIDTGGPLQIDHYQPISKGGGNDLDNLVYACAHCNRFKGSYWPDADSPDSFHLLHPLEDDLTAHIQLTADGRLIGLTPRGWFHIRWLHLNRPQLILWRQNQQWLQELQQALRQSEAAGRHLQERIYLLEQELTNLRTQLARLTN